ncbi:MAG: DMT family transporter [Bacteroidales bacterium]|nr:DMT family transporter [Bacteroidales bacterium]
MKHLGEIISLLVAVSWTFSAWFADKSSHRIGAMVTNVIRLALATIFLAVLLWITIGYPYPAFADAKTWLWLALSALVGYVFGDFCLFNCYLHIGPRFGQLFMTVAPPAAAIAGFFLLGEAFTWKTCLAMAVTLAGIAISILSRGGDKHIRLSLPFKGILLGLGAGIGQGVGLVLSKVGMEHYAAALPQEAPRAMQIMLPFASTLIRAIIGFAGFFAIVALQKNLGRLKAGVKDKTGMKYATLLTLFGPVFGVSLSLMAVRYADAGIASTLMALTPVMIIVPDVLINKKKPSLREIIGVVVTMLGVSLFFLYQ